MLDLPLGCLIDLNPSVCSVQREVLGERPHPLKEEYAKYVEASPVKSLVEPPGSKEAKAGEAIADNPTSDGNPDNNSSSSNSSSSNETSKDATHHITHSSSSSSEATVDVSERDAHHSGSSAKQLASAGATKYDFTIARATHGLNGRVSDLVKLIINRPETEMA